MYVGFLPMSGDKPFTDTVLPATSEPDPEKSSKFIPDMVTTLIVMIGVGVAPVNNGDNPVSENPLLSWLIFPT